MADNVDRNDQPRGREHLLENWEEQCVQDWEDEVNMDDRFVTESDRTSQKLWLDFQNSATAISQLYRDHCNPDTMSLWVPFQQAAGSVTQLYKDGLAASRHSSDAAIRLGYVRRTREILSWLKHRKHRHIRREELMGFLCGKPPPTRRHSHHHGWSSHAKSSRVSPNRTRHTHDDPHEPDLRPFRDALALQCLDGAMSKVSMSYEGQHGSSSLDPRTTADASNLHRFVLDEMAKRCDARKRTSSNEHINIDSPTRKRPRIL